MTSRATQAEVNEAAARKAAGRPRRFTDEQEDQLARRYVDTECSLRVLGAIEDCDHSVIRTAIRRSLKRAAKAS